MNSAAPGGRDDAAAVAWLRSPQAIRARARQLHERAVAGGSDWFEVRAERLDEVAARVAEVTKAAYPTLEIPVHGRATHFDVGGVDRLGEVKAQLVAAGAAPEEQARALVDLIVVSVLVDAGAGTAWRYVDRDGKTYARSEGLAVASLRMFQAGAFSSDPTRPLRADAAGLARLDEAALARGFQVSAENPLVGVAGRLALLHGLGKSLSRPGALVDRLAAGARGGAVRASAILAEVLASLGGIWPGRVTLAGVNLGDVWPHPALAPADAPLRERLVPFHKLSQWLSYSLFEPLAAAGLRVDGAEELTGLAEYRNGGLFVDGGVLVARRPELLTEAFAPGHEAIVEWRALTIVLLDELRPRVCRALGLADDALALANVIQGGTWSTGRALAAERRAGGGSPIAIASDGTVF